LQVSKNRIKRREELEDELDRVDELRASGEPLNADSLARQIVAFGEKHPGWQTSEDEDVKKQGNELMGKYKDAQLLTRRGYEKLQADIKSLEEDVMEVRCPDCNSFVWCSDPQHENLDDDESKERASECVVATWNKAVEKQDNMKDCCLAAERRVDADGMVTIVCRECHQRYHPLGGDKVSFSAPPKRKTKKKKARK
jgi:hypothetical protein